MRKPTASWVLVIVVSLVAAGSMAFGVVQSEALGNAHRQLAKLDRKLNGEEQVVFTAVKALVTLRHQVTTLQAEGAATTTTVPAVAPVVLTDPQLLVSTLDNVAEQLMGSLPPAGQAQEFVNQYQAAELHNAQLQSEGLPSVALDPTAEATAFIKQHDQAAVLAAGVAQEGQILNCMINPGAPGCQSSSVP